MPELIDKAKLLEYLAAIKPDEYVSAYGEAAVDVINHVEEYVNEMPAIEPEVRHGRWYDHAHTDTGVCSECGCVFTDETPYCPNCGAKMDGGEENAD